MLFIDMKSNFKDVHFKLTGSIDEGNKVASFKKGAQYTRLQNVENLGILIINKTVVITCNPYNYFAILQQLVVITYLL